MYEGGRSLQTSLAVMFSSPTLNIIVLTMLFTLFPFYVALIKLDFTIFLILVIVPFITHKQNEQEPIACAIPDTPVINSESWGQALFGIFKDYSESFAYIVYRTVPLMFVAGFLGALVSHVWDPNTLIGTHPSFWAIATISVFGTFLPMPIAFNVMLAQSLFAADVPIVIVMALLFTLGTFSVYSGFIIWRTFSTKLAILLFAIVAVLGIAAGYVEQTITDYKDQKWEQQYTNEVLRGDRKHVGTIQRRDINKFALYGLQDTVSPVNENYYSKKNFIVTRSLYSPANIEGTLPFTKYKAVDLGIDSYNKIDESNFVEPFFLGTGLASGDFNNDGWQDIYVANGSVYAAFVGPTTHSPNMFFHNRNGEKFLLKHVSFGLDDFDHSSAFTYIDNDGDLDIIGNTTHGGLKVFKNNLKENNAITIKINDEIGNANCIGCKVLIATGTGENEIKQIREIKTGGGFLSLDAHYAHFGLGDETVVNKLAIIWSTGEKTLFSKEFHAGYTYTINRTSIANVALE